MHPIFAKAGPDSVPILFVSADNLDTATKILDAREHVFVRAAGFEPKPGRHLVVPAADGKLAGVLFGVENADEPVKDLFRPGALAGLLPPGTYRFANAPHDARLAALAIALGCYQFTRYRKGESRDIRLVLPEGVDGEDLSRIIEGVTLARDLINTPSNDMGPAELEDAARALAKKHGVQVSIVSGDALAKQFPLVHAVGAGSARAPRLIDFTWGKDSDPKITLVGKGRVFRYWRARHQVRHRHAQYEKGHGGRGDRAGAGAHDHGAQIERALARHHPGGGKFDFRHQLPPARHLYIAQRHLGRDRQYRRGRPARARRCARIG